MSCPKFTLFYFKQFNQFRFGFFIIFLFVTLTSLNAQVTGTITKHESRCQADGWIKISNANPTSEYAITKAGLQIGPFTPDGANMVLFDLLDPGNWTITEFKLDNSQPTQVVTVTGNYFQNWSFSAQVDFQQCVNGTPVVKINNFQITGAPANQQRPPFEYRISAKNGTLPANGTEPPAYQNVTEFNIPFPSGVGGNYQLQARDSCGNFKTINIQVPAFAPSPTASSSFIIYNNCAGDAIYRLTASGGTGPYDFKITSGPNQVGTEQTNVLQADFTLSAGGTYNFLITDECGGTTTNQVIVKPYGPPVLTVLGGNGSCTPAPNGTGTVHIKTVQEGLPPYTVTINSNCGYSNTINNANSDFTVSGIQRPCDLTISVSDACGNIAKQSISLVAPGPGVLECSSSILCPSGASTNYIASVGISDLHPYHPSPPFTYTIKNASNVVMGTSTTSNFSYNLALAPGNYTYTVTDACNASCSGTLNMPTYQNPTVSYDAMNKCFGAGQVIIIGVNNNPINPTIYTYSVLSGPSKVGQGPEFDSPPNQGMFSNLVSGGNYVFNFNDGCKNVTTAVHIPTYIQPTWEVGYGLICPGSTTANLQIVNLQPAGYVVEPYRWKLISTNSNLYSGPLPNPDAIGQTDSTFYNLPPKSGNATATYNFIGYDECKNSYLGSGKVGLFPAEALTLNKNAVCGDNATIIARVTVPIVGGTYIYYRNGIQVASSNLLFTNIFPAYPGTYTAKIIGGTLPDTCSGFTSQKIVGTSGPVPTCSIVKLLTCLSKGSVTVNTTGGVTPYTYKWNTNPTQTTQTISNLNPGNYTVTVTDAQGCTEACTIAMPQPVGCLCPLTYTMPSPPSCDNNGTPYLPTDDRLKFTLKVMSVDTNQTYLVNVSPGSVTPSVSAYGVATEFIMQEGSASGGNVTVTIKDTKHQECTLTININNPGTCSPICSFISAGLTDKICDNNGTQGTISDDFIKLALNPTGSGLNTNYTVSIISGGGTIVPNVGLYGQKTYFQLNPGSASGGTKVLRITDSIDPNCPIDVTITSPGTCSNCPNPPCTTINTLKN